MVAFPPCKINLGLQIIAKRPDGYHDLSTCFYPIPWSDILEVIPADKFSFSCSGDLIPGPVDENLCVKAFQLIQRDYNISAVAIHLHKVIPTGAGLGGGSSDAAYTLKLVNQLFELNISVERLMAYAAVLGSDCAFFVQDAPMIGTGRGEVLKPVSLSLKGKYIILIKPDMHISTREAYSGVRPSLPVMFVEEIVEQHPVNEWKDLLYNDFEASILANYPEIATIKQNLYDNGAIYASMSGSGSTVFGIFERPVQMEFPKSYKHWQGFL